MARFAQTLKLILEERPKVTDKEALELRKKQQLQARREEETGGLPRKLLEFEHFKDEILDTQV